MTTDRKALEIKILIYETPESNGTATKVLELACELSGLQTVYTSDEEAFKRAIRSPDNFDAIIIHDGSNTGPDRGDPLYKNDTPGSFALKELKKSGSTNRATSVAIYGAFPNRNHIEMFEKLGADKVFTSGDMVHYNMAEIVGILLGIEVEESETIERRQEVNEAGREELLERFANTDTGKDGRGL